MQGTTPFFLMSRRPQPIKVQRSNTPCWTDRAGVRHLSDTKYCSRNPPNGIWFGFYRRIFLQAPSGCCPSELDSCARKLLIYITATLNCAITNGQAFWTRWIIYSSLAGLSSKLGKPSIKSNRPCFKSTACLRSNKKKNSVVRFIESAHLSRTVGLQPARRLHAINSFHAAGLNGRRRIQCRAAFVAAGWFLFPR